MLFYLFLILDEGQNEYKYKGKYTGTGHSKATLSYFSETNYCTLLILTKT